MTEFNDFVGRSSELDQLKLLLKKKTASLVVIKGRRRIGKSRLVEEFAKDAKLYHFAGLAPTKETTAQDQRDEFANQLQAQTGFPNLRFNDWHQAFALLAEKIKHGRAILFLDEISWMGDRDPAFLSKLKNAWDMHYKKNPKLVMVLCGSVSQWIEKNILSSTGFFGRIAKEMTLEELPLYDCNCMLASSGFKGSSYEKLMLLAVTGGVPWYIENIQPTLSAVENIKRLCFEKDGLLVKEYNKIFHDLFSSRSIINKKIVETLVSGSKEYAEISEAINYPSGGPLSAYLEELLNSGFITKDSAWSIKTGKATVLSRYRLRDNYLRFYLRYIAPKRNKIDKGQYANISLSALPAWDGIIGLQFENLVLNNRSLIQKKLHIRPEDIVEDNPFFQHKTSRQRGCQIDYLIQTCYKTLYVCEVKFSKDVLGHKVIEEMQQKINRLALPKGFVCHPVLIHINKVSNAVKDSEYLYDIIDFTELLAQPV
jgi:uncharacterized protein